MLHQSAILAATCLSATLAVAQPIASITVTANGGAAAVVQPGEAVIISAVLWQNQFSTAGMAGGTILSDHAGQASGFNTPIPALPAVNFGGFQGGSRVDADFAFTPPGFTAPGPFPWGQTTFQIWRYNVTLDTPGDYHINWVPVASAPNIRLYPTVASFSFIEAQSTYIGATITVVPAPGTASLLLSPTITLLRRRRV